MMPVNQRPPAWRGEVLANLVLPGRVESRPAERASPRELLAAVVAQTTHIKTHGVSGTTDPVPRRTPVLLRRLLPHLIDAASDRMADTAVLSNLGRVENPPWFGAKGTGLWFSPPSPACHPHDRCRHCRGPRRGQPPLVQARVLRTRRSRARRHAPHVSRGGAIGSTNAKRLTRPCPSATRPEGADAVS